MMNQNSNYDEEEDEPEADSSSPLISARFLGTVPDDVELAGVEIEREEATEAFIGIAGDERGLQGEDEVSGFLNRSPDEISTREFRPNVHILRKEVLQNDLPKSMPPRPNRDQLEEERSPISPEQTGALGVTNNGTDGERSTRLLNFRRLADASISLVALGLLLLAISIINPVVPSSFVAQPRPVNEVIPLFLIAEGVLILSGVTGWLYGRFRYE